MRNAVDIAAQQVSEGSSLSLTLEQSGYFNPMLINLIASGEATGQLEQMLERAATNQERELETTMAMLMGLLEPLLIVVMGGVRLSPDFVEAYHRVVGAGLLDILRAVRTPVRRETLPALNAVPLVVHGDAIFGLVESSRLRTTLKAFRVVTVITEYGSVDVLDIRKLPFRLDREIGPIEGLPLCGSLCVVLCLAGHGAGAAAHALLQVDYH